MSGDGVVLPLTFDAVDAAVKEGALAKLVRLPHEQKRYLDFTKQVLADFETVEDYLLCEVFGRACTVGPSGKKHAHAREVRRTPRVNKAGVQPSNPLTQSCSLTAWWVACGPRQQEDGLSIAWRPNDFPYALHDSVRHHILWSTKPLTEKQLAQVSASKRMLSKAFPSPNAADPSCVTLRCGAVGRKSHPSAARRG